MLTPHEAELARLLEISTEEVRDHRLQHAREAAELSGAVVLLKGDDTIIARPGGPVAISPGGTPALATAGTGDVLSGLIGALLAKGMDPFEAAALGALAHVAGRARGGGAPGPGPRDGGRRDRSAARGPDPPVVQSSVLPRAPIRCTKQDARKKTTPSPLL